MRIAHVGLGAMGQAIKNACVQMKCESVASIESGDKINLQTLNNADIAIDCTTPEGFLKNFDSFIECKQDVLVVTTGWYAEVDRIKKIVESSGIRFLYASNYSVGVHLYFRIVEYASKLVNNVSEYDIWGTELHHKNKIDSPSGTAKTLQDIILRNVERKTKIQEGCLDRKIEDQELHFSSTRGGAVNFSHTIGLDSSFDTIKLSHSARSRDGYGMGALACAEWLLKKSPGFYTIDDYLEELFGSQ